MMAYPSADASRAFMDLDDADVVHAVLEDLHRVYPALSDNVESTVVYRGGMPARNCAPAICAAERRCAMLSRRGPPGLRR